MLTLTLLTALLPLLTFTAAHNAPPPHLRHRRIANGVEQIRDSQPGARAIDNTPGQGHANAHRLIKKTIQKRGKTCRPRGSTADAQFAQGGGNPGPNAASSITSSTTSSSSSPTPSSTGDTWSSTSSASWSEPTGSLGSVSGLLAVTDSRCGPCGSSHDAPNGSEDWLNCGVTGGGWTPPMVRLGDIIHGDLSANGIFSPCADYIDKFNSIGAQHGIPGIMVASFAMQESTCNPSATGGNGEAGLMQLTHENCGGAPGGNCYDIDFNIGRGAELFSGLIDKFGGNVVSAVGYYNGWSDGLTIGSATAAKDQGRCAAQNNLDYLHQFFNGWLQGKNAYSMGQYFNLRDC